MKRQLRGKVLKNTRAGVVLVALLGAALPGGALEPCRNHSDFRQPFFGDTHVHTSYSFDARAQDTRAIPTDAYRFARGEPLLIQPFDEKGVGQRKIQIDRPLDFTAVTGHAEFLGEVKICYTPGMEGYSSWPCRLHRNFASAGMQVFSMVTMLDRDRFDFCDNPRALNRAVLQSTSEPYRSVPGPRRSGTPLDDFSTINAGVIRGRLD